MNDEPGVDEVLRRSEILRTEGEIDAAYRAMAAAITERIGDASPLVLATMIGGLVPAARLLEYMSFPLELDYVHATRYRGDTAGRDLQWLAHPSSSLAGRVVLVVDDILDEGITLEAILKHCRDAGASEVLSAVLVDKNLGRPRVLERADFTGVTVEDRYVFGCGMDYHGYFRNLPAIYALEAS